MDNDTSAMPAAPSDDDTQSGTTEENKEGVEAPAEEGVTGGNIPDTAGEATTEENPTSTPGAIPADDDDEEEEDKETAEEETPAAE